MTPVLPPTREWLQQAALRFERALAKARRYGGATEDLEAFGRGLARVAELLVSLVKPGRIGVAACEG